MIEVELKSLLQTQENAEKLKQKLAETDPGLCLIERNQQKNHYFIEGDFAKLLQVLSPHLDDVRRDKLALFAQTDNYSLRTREVGNKLLLVLKGSLTQESSQNAKARQEVEIPFNTLSLAQLDQLVLSAGFKYQAKWSRQREEYQYQDIIVCIDKNAGYGYLAEVEKMVSDTSQVAETEAYLRRLLQKLDLTELPQDRLERMFKYYNQNWPAYYGTEKIFEIE